MQIKQFRMAILCNHTNFYANDKKITKTNRKATKTNKFRQKLTKTNDKN